MERSEIITALKLQYTKALNILEKAVTHYDEKLWLDKDGYPWASWQTANHALFYTNLYLAPAHDKLVPWPDYREHYEILGRTPWPPHDIFTPEESYSREDILRFIGHIRENLDSYLEGFEPLAPCWPDWYDENQMEFHMNNLRHLQHHTGALIERHDIISNLDCGWQ